MKENRFIIKIPKLKLFGYHGCYDEEKKKGQEFEVEIEITIVPIEASKMFSENSVDSSEPTLEQDTIDYVEIENQIKRLFNTERCDLLERLAARISTIPYGLAESGSKLEKEIYSVSVIIRKNNPIGMSVPYVQVKYINYNDEAY